MTQGVLKTHGICLMMYFKNNWNAGPFFFTSTLNVSIYSENRRGIYVRFRSPSFGPQKTITTWLTKTEIFTLH